MFSERRILRALQRSNIPVPDDYFEKVDKYGKYNGRKLTARYLKRQNRRRNPGKNSKPDAEETEVSTMSLSGPGVTRYFVPMAVFVHTDANGNRGVGEQLMLDMLQTAIELFREQSDGTIELYIQDIIEISNSNHFTFPSESDEAVMFNNHKMLSALNIHFVGDGKGSEAAGSVSGIGEPFAWVDGRASMETLTHEIGHAFGLWHTHRNRGFFNADNGDASNCYQEPVSRTRTQGLGCVWQIGARKCSANGDRLCDTPGDPRQSTDCFTNLNNRCEYSPFPSQCDDVDNWGDTWSPPTRNIMSYSNRQRNQVLCRNQFSLGQIGEMIVNLSSSTYDFTHSHGANTITGPTSVCPGDFYTYSYSSGSADLWWDVDADLALVNTSGNQATVSIPSVPYSESKFVYVSRVPTTPNSVSNTPQTFIPLPNRSVEPLQLHVNDLVADISGPAAINEGGNCYNFSTQSYAGVSYNWTITPILDPSSPPLIPTPYFCSGQTSNTPRVAAPVDSPDFYLLATINSVCGSTLYASRIISTEYDGPIIAPPGGGLNATSELEISVFPNPGDGDQLYLKEAEQYKRADEKRIIVSEASSGKMILEQSSTQQDKNLLEGIHLTPGVYIIRVEDNKGMKIFKHVVK